MIIVSAFILPLLGYTLRRTADNIILYQNINRRSICHKSKYRAAWYIKHKIVLRTHYKGLRASSAG